MTAKRAQEGIFSGTGCLPQPILPSGSWAPVPSRASPSGSCQIQPHVLSCPCPCGAHPDHTGAGGQGRGCGSGQEGRRNLKGRIQAFQ